VTQNAPSLPTTCGSFTLLLRLDLQVSGCIAFAKSKRAAAHFHQLLGRAEDHNSVDGSAGGRGGGVRKIYRAVTFRAVPTGMCTHWALPRVPRTGTRAHLRSGASGGAVGRGGAKATGGGLWLGVVEGEGEKDGRGRHWGGWSLGGEPEVMCCCEGYATQPGGKKCKK